MTSINKTTPMPESALVCAPTTGEAAPTKRSPSLDFGSIVSNPKAQYPMTIIVAITINTPIPDATNTPVDTTEAFKTIVSDITDTLPYLIAPFSYEPKTVLIQLEDLKKELIDTAATYKAALTHPKKSLLITINAPLNILTVHLQEHRTHSSTTLNINPALKYEATIKTHRFQKVKNHLVDVVTPPTLDDSCTTTSSSDVCISDKMNTHP